MIKKTKFSTITAVIATIAAIAVGSIGGIGLGQQQTALAQPVDSRDIGEDGIAVGGIGDTVRDILEDDDNAGAILSGCAAQFESCEREAIISALGCDILRPLEGGGFGDLE